MDISSKDDAWFSEWTAKWDAMQDAYVPGRREAFRLIVDVLVEQFPNECRVIDLGAGAGTLAEEILNRHPNASALCLDVEPFLLEAARRRLKPFGDRAKVVRCDMRKEGFTTEDTELTEEDSAEAVVSSTTLHWFGEGILEKTFAACAKVLVPGGLFMNTDHIQSDDPAIARLALDLNEAERAAIFQRTRAMTWDEFWDGLGAELSPDQYYDTVACPAWGEQDGPEPGHTVSTYTALLRQAGFRDIGILWRHLANALLIATR